jgi:hypothetical protein
MADWPPERPDPNLVAMLRAAVAILLIVAVFFGSGVDLTLTSGNASATLSTGARRAYNVRVGQLPGTPSWPDTSNTGVPPGTTLTTYTGSCTINVANTVIDSKIVDCAAEGVSIQAANVTIIRSQVLGLVRLDPDSSGYVASGGTWSITVTDSYINAGVIQQAALCCANMDVLRARLSGGQTGAQCEVGKWCRIRDSYLAERAVHTGSWHLGGFLSDGTGGASCTGVGGNGLCIEMTHNTVWCNVAQNGVPDDGCSGDLQLIPNFARVEKVSIVGNLFPANVDAAYCTFGGDKSDSTWRYGRNIVYQDNVFARGSNNMCAAFGPVTDFGSDSTNNPGNTWTNNRYDDGVLIPAP